MPTSSPRHLIATSCAPLLLACATLALSDRALAQQGPDDMSFGVDEIELPEERETKEAGEGAGEDPLDEDDLSQEEPPPQRAAPTVEPTLKDRAGHLWHLGLTAGLNYSRLGPPNDPAGTTTLLFGSAFAGFGLVIGPTLSYTVALLDSGAALQLRTGALYSQNNGAGEAANASQTERQTIELTSQNLRVPLMVQWHSALSTDPFDVHAALGVEAQFGIQSGALVTNEGIPGDVPVLQTTPTTQLGLSALLGTSLQLTDRVSLPLELQFTYNPFTPSATSERFEGFESQQNPGQYGVRFDYHIMLTLGVTFGL